MKLSVIILTKNEEENILDCLESVAFADEIIIIDDFSSDRIHEIVGSIKMQNIKIYQNHLNDNFAQQRNFGLLKAKGDWVLFIDADERVLPQLAAEIIQKTRDPNSNTKAYLINRIDNMWGKKLKFGETGNIKLLRLAKKDSGKWSGKVHEVWNIEGKQDLLNNALMHYPHPSISEFLYEISFYSSLRAGELRDAHVKTSIVQILFYPKAKFFINYVLKLGFLDGVPGLLVAMMMSLHSFLVRSKLWLINLK